MFCNRIGALSLILLSLASVGPVAAEPLSELLQRGHEQVRDAAADPQATFILVDRALTLARQRADVEAEALALEQLAVLYQGVDRRRDALQLTRQALFAVQGRPLPALLFRLQVRRARLLEMLDQPGSLDAWRAAERALARQRAVVDGPSGLSAEAVQNFYSNLVQRLLVAAHGDAEQALLREARATWESGKIAELRDHLGEHCILPRAELGSTAASATDSAVAVLYTLLLPDRLELLLDLDGRLLRHGNRLDRARLPRVARRFVDAVAQRRLDHGRYARLLHRVLIAPFLPTLRQAGVRTLVLVPDGILRSVPMAALQDAQGRYLAEDFALAHTPGLSLLQSNGSQDADGRMLVAGLGGAAQARARRFQPLPGAAAEMDWLLRNFPATGLRDQAFDREALRRVLGEGGFSRIHLASHAEISPHPADGFLLTADGGMPLIELQRLIARQRFDAQPLDLLTLSACSTAVGDRRAALGLGGLAVQTGARSALASLWQVNDAASSRLMQAFYGHLDSSGKARALQQAQGELIAAGLDHPYYWAGFVLIGSWD